VIALFLLVHPVMGLITLICIGCLDVLLMGSLYAVGLDMTAIMYVIVLCSFMFSSIVVVMAIGFGVEYFTNIGHGFMISFGTRNERVIGSLADLGGSVLNGGFTTALAVVVLAGSSSDVFFTFFTVTLAMVFISELVAFTLLPVLLSYIGPEPLINVTKTLAAPAEPNNGKLVDV